MQSPSEPADAIAAELRWLDAFTPTTRAAASSLPSLADERILVVCHLDLKMLPYFEALVNKSAEVHAATVRSPSKHSTFARTAFSWRTSATRAASFR